MRNQNGFSMIELAVVMAIFAVILTIGTPAFLSWRENSAMRGSSSNFRADLEYAKMSAIRENLPSVVDFISNSEYRVFVDRTQPANYTYDDGVDTLVQSRTLQGAVQFNANTFSNSRIQFDGRGLTTPGTIDLVGINQTRRFSLNRIGNITVTKP